MLRRRSIRMRILILVVVPLVALTAMYAVVLGITLGNLVSLSNGANVRADIAQPVTNLQYQLDQEETDAAIYVASSTSAERAALIAQEHQTDLAVTKFRLAAASAAAKSSDQVRAATRALSRQLNQLSGLRRVIAGSGFYPVQVVQTYSQFINAGNLVLDQVDNPLVNGPLGTQASNLTSLAVVPHQIAEENALLQGDVASGSFRFGDQQLFSFLATSRANIWQQALAELPVSYQHALNVAVPMGLLQQLSNLEAKVEYNEPGSGHLSGPTQLVPMPTWITTANTVVTSMRRALSSAENTLQSATVSQEHALQRRLLLTAALGLAAVVLAVGFAIIISRGLVRQLEDLRRSASELADKRLPEAIGRLRAGQSVDVAAELPEPDQVANEFGEVRRAFREVQRTAIEAAVDEARIRRGVNDVFRNLARRNQSLLSRQLQLLDKMERRIHDPEELADLFRLDHLTTRMRRHAEGLLILSGGSSGRVWREPVPFVDVMRAAIAEVEDYTRIRVMSRTTAAVAGHAVADVIHLLAELIENATIFSPANTPVRVEGDLVGNGLAVEIEDRGLGMSDAQRDEINRHLDEPPMFDLSGSQQLGLFIAGQLARKHDIKVTLRSSAYGGTTAVVLIPSTLVVPDEDDLPLGLTAGPDTGERLMPELPVGPAGTEDLAGLLLEPGLEPESAPWPEPVPERGPEAPEPIDVPDFVAGSNSITVPRLATLAPDAAAETPAPPALPVRKRDADAPTIEVSALDVATAEPNGHSAPGGIDTDDLPVRVRQASLAPQLRERGSSARPAFLGDREGDADGDDLAAPVSPEAAQSTMSALQKGWERGRSWSPSATQGGDEDVPDQPGGDRH